MSKGAVATRAMVLAAWREQWNRGWRFSPAKTGLWLFLTPAAFAGLALWRLGGQEIESGVPLALSALCIQAAVAGCLDGFATGQLRLYGVKTLPLLHVSPAPGFSVVAAELAARLPERAWRGLCWSVGLGFLLPPASRLWGVPLLWVAGVLVGLLGRAAGLLALLLVARRTPGMLKGARNLMMAVQLGLMLYLIYLVAVGADLTALGQALRVGTGFLFGMAGIVGLPGVAMAIWAVRSPDKAGEAYREGWLNLMELAGEAGRPQCSRWPALADGSPGAVQAMEWLQAWRNRLTLDRVGVWALALALVLWQRGWLGRIAADRHDLIVLGLATGLLWFALGEQVGALNSTDRQRFSLYILAGVRPGRLLLGKLLAALPYVLLGLLGAWVASSAAGDPVPEQVRLALYGGGIALGMAVIMVGGSAAGAGPGGEEEQDQSPELSAIFEQVPRGKAAWVAYLGATGFAAGAIWTAGGMPGAGPLLAAGLACMPLIAAAAGYISLRRVLGR